MRGFSTWIVAGAVCASAGVGAIQAQSVPIPNGDFTSPDASALPYAVPAVNNWHRAPVPTWWQGASTDWDQTTGVFYNVGGPTFIQNLTSSQAAFMYATPDVELYQDLTATYQVGRSYHLSFGLIGSVATIYTDALNPQASIRLGLYYRDAGNNKILIDAKSVLGSDPGLASHTWLAPYQLDIPDVAAGDAWAGLPIGVQILSTADLGHLGGVWDVGNVELVAATPEPASLGLLAMGLGALALRRRRRVD